MFQNDFSVFIGEEKKLGYSGFITLDNFYLVIDVEEGINKENGQQILKSIGDDIIKSDFFKLHNFESFINDKLKQLNLPSNVSISTGYLKDNLIYLKTVGNGEIYVKRKDKLIKLIQGDNSASGFVQLDDLIIFTTNKFSQHFSSIEDLKRHISGKLTLKMNEGEVAIFNSFKLISSPLQKKEPQIITTISISDRFKNVSDNIKRHLTSTSKGKRITAVLLIIIILILIWSIGFGYKRRFDDRANKNIQITKELITQKLSEAADIAYLNTSRALSLIAESKFEVNKLRIKYGKTKLTEINIIDQMIKNQENKITKKEEKSFEEFYDLAVDTKDASGSQLYLDRDKMIILDNNKNTIYTLSLTEKSFDKVSFTEIKTANLIANYQDDIFFINNSGIYQINSDNKLKKIIDRDQEWGKIVGINIYNGNIYILDQLKDEIYKYLVAENGYSGKVSYFATGQSISLHNANSLTIDSSVYVGFKDYISKFSSGVKDEFSTTFPDTNINIEKVITNKDLDKVYALDKTKGAIYVLGKNGTYEREINSSVLKRASDIIIYNNLAYILVGSKIYKINLN